MPESISKTDPSGMTALSIAPFSGSPEAWDAFLTRQPGWTIFHRYAWKGVIERVFGHRCDYLAATDSAGTLQGVLPLVELRSLLFGRYLVSMPFVNYGGPLGSDAAVAGLARAAVELAGSRRSKLLELRSRAPLPVELPVSHRKVTVVLDLTPGAPERLWQAIGSKVRSQIKRPQKEGVEVRFGSEQVEPFYQVFRHHMRDLGTPTQSLAFFQALREAFGDSMWAGAAWYQGEPVAGGIGFRWGNEFEMTWASSLVAHQRIAPNMLLYWAFMERCAQEGLQLFNFGRCTPGAGTHRFKRQWGSRDEQLWWYQYTGDGAEAATPSPDDSRYSWGPRLWRHLPVPLASALGPWIVRGIP
jgi:FemAB-related protein (PEP-CTERM system-associated)